ncbi:class II histone deacetylase complex subunits 2 and 3 [Pycnococcus provasolii]|uniref:Class II histone deacetylase complex subunits 2 and 3 n=1 Tax=Pycnococcus provasolii TaxID=41880 RepID=A0A830HVE5_9CHLO|nr:class II histone deacetylase complex subunits 2 and 3 [Pycnococcus provasolii]
MGSPPAAAAAAAPSSAARQGDPVAVDAPDAEVIVGVDQTLLEEELLLEAERLKKQSEEKQNQQQEQQLHTAALSGAEAANGVTPALSADRFHQLNVLLDQTSLYSMFLSEQMETLDQQTANDDAGAEPPSKRKKANGADAEKPGTSNGKTAELLPLMTGGEMRDYQLKGVKWMISLYQNGLNGILADQMGLGKTVQTIGFISHLRSKNVLGPYLIVAPLSTLPNWISEFARWAPSIPAILYHGSKQERAAIRNSKLRIPRSQAVDESFPVICTSYEIVIADRKFLQKYHFKYIVVDEGHRLKNFDCKLVRELRTIPTNNKLLLTGTPLQNNLPELWSLLNFLLPDVFTSLGDFQSWFDFTADDVGGEGAGREGESASPEEQRAKVVSKLHNILRPFLLRRLKADVETSLPRKKEMILYAQMTKTQRDINKKLVEKTIEEAMRKLAAAGTSMGGGALTSLNNTLMQCRKNCNHPDLITGPYDGSLVFPPIDELVKQCGKMQLLDRLLKKLKARGHKVLIFSQMTKMLDLLEYYLEGKGITPCRIDGNVSYQDRQRFMKEFNSNPEVFCFLLSTRAGGLGINLTAADTVIIYDSDWNPHQDMQAMDRCHRIGQTRPVHVYRLCTSHSVEGRMLERANSKLKLMRIVMKKGEFEDKQLKKVADQKEGGGASGMKAEELLEMLKDDIKQENISQSADITDGMLERLLDRSDLVDGGKTAAKGKDLPTVGVGYEVVEEKDGASLLANVE